MQYRTFSILATINDTDIALVATISGNTLSASVARDGSEETNFKDAVWTFRQAAGDAPATSTSLPCSVLTRNKWFKAAASTSLTTPSTVIDVPTGNSGHLVLRVDPTTATTNYKKNSGSWTAFTDGTVITVADGDSLAFQATSIPSDPAQVTGSVEDQDTGVTLDVISIYNTTP